MLPCILLLCNCSDWFEYHPYDARVTGETGINAKNILRIENDLWGDTLFRFAVISDTQRWYDDTEDAVQAINERGDADFIIHCGDQADFGGTKEFMWMRSLFRHFSKPYVCLLGNHDCLATGQSVFQKIYGPINFSFTAGDVQFICLNTNALEYDYSEPVPDFNYIWEQLEKLPPNVKKSVFAMHIAPFSAEFNNNVAYFFQEAVKRFPNPLFAVYGHGHSVEVNDLFHDGFLYYECACVHKRSYLLFTIHPNGYDYEVVEF